MLTSRVAQSTRVLVVCALAILISYSNLSAQTTNLPAPWNAQDVGSPTTPGRSTYDQGQFTITAAGQDIWEQSDQFHFVYQQISGDVDLIARVDSLQLTNVWAKAGVMIRQSLAANSAHGFAFVSADRGVAFQYRASTGGASSHVSGPGQGPPQWVRLIRIGSALTAYSSVDGKLWQTIGSITIPLQSSAYVGLAVTSHSWSTTTTAVVSQVTVSQLTLPSRLKSMDIGSPAIAGSVSYRQGVYTVHAAGRDIWDASDQFHFVYQQVSGDVEVIARLNSLTYTNQWAKGGVMIRGTLTAGSRHASALATAGSGYAFQRRPDTGGLSVHTSGPAGAPPGWVRLVRTGTQIEAFRSLDGTNWTSMGTDAIPMASTVYVGLATTSHNTAAATDAVFDNFTVKPVTAAPNQPPIVALTAPAGGTTLTAGTSLSISAAASDSDGTISRVDFYAGTTLIGSDATSPYQVAWSSVPVGTYSLTAVAVDNDGAKTTSPSVTVTAQSAANQPPAVTLTSPANGATYTAPASMALTASASDPNGTVARVEFYNGTTLLNSDTTAPYAFTWSSVAAGTYALRAVAYDNAGGSGSSATATITVSGGTSNGLIGAYGINAGTGTTVKTDLGTGPQGTMTGAAWTAGKYGQALSFAGSGEVTFGDLDLAGSFTVMGWLQTRSLFTSGCGSFVMKALDYGFEICGGRLYAGVGANGAWSARASQALTSADLNVWKHVALTYDGTTVRLYVGGALAGSAAGAHITNNNPLLFGHWVPSGEYWNGLVDEVRLYSRTLTQGEIQTDMATPIAGATGNQPPTVTLTAPANGATYTAPATMTLSATASDPENSVARVEFYSGTTLLATDTTAPYSYSWGSVAAGTYGLRAVAYDSAGASASSATATVTVTTGNQPPTVTLTSPATGATFTAPAAVVLSATASDPENSLARVEFYSGTTRLATDTTAPYSYSWGSVAAGTYSVRAIAYDTAGGTASSVFSTITVSAATTTLPKGVVFQASTDHATLVSRYELRIFVSGANVLTATPLATSDLGKPTPDANGDITVDRATFFSNLAVGGYVAAVSAIGSGGTATSTGVSFTR
jgi:regulation of enolase protein 1 (concanavalin A-like superfamily)